MEIEREMKVVKKVMMCNECGVGEMKPTGVALMSNPPQYPHKCNNCGKHETYRKSYPTIEFVEV